jgi:hypothetical protein
MNTPTPTLVDTTVAAQDAPLGVCLWPVKDEQYAPNFTLERVETIRTANGTHVRWVYQSGKDRWFKLGERVAIRVDSHAWTSVALGEIRTALAVPTQAAAAHHAEETATRPTSAVHTPKLTPTQEAYLKWYATGDVGYARGHKGTGGTVRRLQRMKLVEAADANPFYRATTAGRQWLIDNGMAHILGTND